MFYSFDLDLNPMTLILKLDLDMVKTYLYTENEVPSYSGSKVIAWTDRQTDRWTDTQTDIQTFRQTRVKLLPTRIRGYLRADAVLVLRLMEMNSNRLVVSEIIANLWDHFRSNPPMWQAKDSDDSDLVWCPVIPLIVILIAGSF